ncbi:MAG: hypothetical protein ACI87E_003317 [Mariniblastus sp.]
MIIEIQLRPKFGSIDRTPNSTEFANQALIDCGPN